MMNWQSAFEAKDNVISMNDIHGWMNKPIFNRLDSLLDMSDFKTNHTKWILNEYQRFYNEDNLKCPLTSLFIVCRPIQCTFNYEVVMMFLILFEGSYLDCFYHFDVGSFLFAGKFVT